MTQQPAAPAPGSSPGPGEHATRRLAGLDLGSPIVPVLLLGLGAYVAWFGVHYWRSDVAWPTDPLKAFLTGKPLPDRTPPDPATEIGPGLAAANQALNAVANAQNTGPTYPGLGQGAVPGGASRTYGHGDLEQLWTSSGGNPAIANKAAAVAQAESGGRPWVTSPNPDGGTNVGLWQLDTRGKGAGYSVAQLQDPATNARIAIMGSRNGTDWSAWSTTYGHPAKYEKYLT